MLSGSAAAHNAIGGLCARQSCIVLGAKQGDTPAINMQVHRFVLSLKCVTIKRTSTYFVDLFIYCVYVCRFTHAVRKVWKSKDNMQNSIFFFPQMDSGVWTRSSDVTVGILPLSCLTSQIYIISILDCFLFSKYTLLTFLVIEVMGLPTVCP